MAGDDEAARAAFTQAVVPVMPALARLAARLAPSADRDDIVQETLMRAWAKRETYDPARGAFGSWLLAIGAYRARRRRRRRRLVLLPLASEPTLVEPHDDFRDVERAIRQLPPRQRLAVDYFYFVGLSVHETAAVMRCAEGTVKSTLSDARAALRLALEERG